MRSQIVSEREEAAKSVYEINNDRTSPKSGKNTTIIANINPMANQA